MFCCILHCQIASFTRGAEYSQNDHLKNPLLKFANNPPKLATILKLK